MATTSSSSALVLAVNNLKLLSCKLYTPLNSLPLLIGQVIGCKEIFNSASISSIKSNLFLPSRSILLINTMTGVARILHTSINLLVCGSTPFTLSITRITLSTAVNVLYVSSAKSLCPGVSNRLIKLPLYSKDITEVATEIPL